MLLQPNANIQGIESPFNAGDIVSVWQDLFTVNNAAGVTYVGNDLVKGDIDRTGPAGAFQDNLPFADDWIKALSGALTQLTPPNNALYGLEPNKSVTLAFPFNLGFLPPFSCYRLVWRNGGGGILTLAAQASSGVTISGTATLAATSWREYFIQILNSTPSAVIPVTTTNATKTISNVDPNLIQQITSGMSVFGAGVAASTKVAAVNRDTGVITVDTNLTATANNVAVTFTPTIVVKNRLGGATL
jgi:hypothetical protein